MRVLTNFETFFKIVNNPRMNLQIYYVEKESMFKLFALLDGHIFYVEKPYSEITEGMINPEVALAVFRTTYLIGAFEVEDIEFGGVIKEVEKVSTTTGGEGTAGQALLPTQLPGQKPYAGQINWRCSSCGYEGPERNECPKCSGKMQSMATGSPIKVINMPPETLIPMLATIPKEEEELTLEKWVGWNFISAMPWILRFLESYDFNDIDLSEKKRLKIKEIMIESMGKGHSIPIIEDKIDEVVKNKYRAQMIARSETIRAANEGALLQYKENGIIRAKFIATPSAPGGRTCDRCLKLNGKEMPIEKAQGLIPVHPNCFSEDTEVFTNIGWINFKELKGDEMFLSLKPENEDLEWVKAVKKIEYEYDGEMVNFKSRTMDLKVTPNHRMVVSTRPDEEDRGFRKIGFREARDINYSEIPVSTKWVGRRRDNITIGRHIVNFNDFCVFMGYYLSEGSITKRKTAYSQISISQEKHLEKMYEDIQRIFPNARKGKGKIYIFDRDFANYLQMFGKSWEKFVPVEIKESIPEQIRLFLDAFILGDGTVRKSKAWKGGNFEDERNIFTSSKRLMEDLTELIIKCGKSVSIRNPLNDGRKVKFRNGEYGIKHDCWCISELNSNYRIISPKYIKREQYSGKVSCVELEKNHTLFVKRRGKTAWCGNCRCTFSPVVETHE